MILVDTNILIDYLRYDSEVIRETIANNCVAVCGVIETELLRGCRDLEQRKVATCLIETFYFIDMERPDWEKLGDFLIQV